MALGSHATKNELLAIFPQHSEETITRIYENVVENVGEDTHVLVLPICIEQLLDLPAAGNNERNNTGTNHLDSGRNIFNFNQTQAPPRPPIPLYEEEINEHIIPCFRNDSDASNDGYNTSSDDDDDEQRMGNENYRNKPRPIYREKQRSHSRSRSISPTDSFLEVSLFNKEDDLIFADIDELNGLEDLVAAPTISSPSIITIKDSPLANRKRKIDNVVNGFDLVDLTNVNGSVAGKPKKKIILKEDVNGTLNGNGNFVPPEPDISTIMKGMVGYMEKTKERVKIIIEDVDNAYLETLINAQVDTPIPQVVQRIVEHLLDNKDYPKVAKYQPQPTASTFKATSTITSSMNTFTYTQQSVILLQNRFPKVSTKVIRKVFYGCNNYTKAVDTIANALQMIISGEKRVEETIIFSLLKGCRSKIKIPDLCSTLSDEIEGMDQKRKDDIEKGDRATAAALNTQQYDEEGQTIECECCYNEVAFDDMVQCLEGHLFCVTCLQSYSKEAIYGSGKAQLFCMTDGCGSTFPMSQMKKALEGDLLDKFMERVQDEDIKLANLDNLIRCPGCDFAAELDEGDKVFRCQNTSCMKETCRYCKEEWKDHFGVPCKELEKKEETNLRTTYEEKMTQAKVRKCWQCSTIFLKSDGCNKMTCRCGAKMCYICRQAKIHYDHFCQHPRNPGEGCTQCKRCNLWTDPSEDDDRAVAEIKKLAEEERMKLGGDEGKISIGPAITVTPACNKTRMLHPRVERLPLLQRLPVPNHPNNPFVYMRIPGQDLNQNQRWR